MALVDANEDTHLDIIEDSCVLLNDGTLAVARKTPALGATVGGAHSAVLTAAFSPNPIRGRGTLGFSLPKDGKVSIHLYDIRGRRVHTLVDGLWMAAGPHAVDLERSAAGLRDGDVLLSDRDGRKSDFEEDRNREPVAYLGGHGGGADEPAAVYYRHERPHET